MRRGATHAVDAGGGIDVVAEVRAITGGGVDHAFEVVGTPATIRLAWDALAPGGTAVVVGLAPVASRSRCRRSSSCRRSRSRAATTARRTSARRSAGLIQLVVDGRLDLADVVSDLIELEGVEAAFERLRRGEGERSVVVIDEELAGVEL